MEIGVDSFAMVVANPDARDLPSPADRIENIMRDVEMADRVGLDVFGMGEHHRESALDSAPAVILAAAAARTKNIRLTSAVTVLSAADPVRVFQEFATLDLISRGRAEIIVGRGSFIEAYPLFGFALENYDELFVEKLDLLMKLNEAPRIAWKGRFRPDLKGEGVFPRPHQSMLPIWLGVGGTPESFARAGTLGLPLMLAVIGGTFEPFRPLVDLYRRAWKAAGHPVGQEKVGLHAMGFVGDTDEDARNGFFPGWFQMFTQGAKERGRPPVSRAQFDTLCGPQGAFLIGSPETVARKMLKASQTLGGLSRISFQMSPAALEADAMQRSIELLGTAVAPQIRRRPQSAGEAQNG